MTAVAAVLSNWHNVLRAINMASSTSIVFKAESSKHADAAAVKITKHKDEQANKKNNAEPDVPLPVTLVRIPTEQVGLIPQPTSGGVAD